MFKIFGDFFGPKYNLEKLKNEMIKHLENKYNKKFFPILLEPHGFQIPYDKLRVYPEGGDKETDVAHVAKFYEKGKPPTFIDNYFGIHIREEYEAIIEKEALKIFDNVKIFSEFYAHSFSDELTCKNTYADAVKLGEFLDSSIRIYVSVPNDGQFAKKVDQFEEYLKKVDIVGDYTIYNLKPDYFEGVNRETYDDYVMEYTKQFDKVCYEVIDGSLDKNDIKG